ncbi:MAG: VCBS repeat-containing protein [Chloroflexota bacterium]
MRHSSQWIIPLAVLLIVVVGIYALFDVEVEPPPPDDLVKTEPTASQTVPPTATAESIPIVNVEPTSPPLDFFEDWGDISDPNNSIDGRIWKAYGHPAPRIIDGGLDGSAAFDPSGDRNYESGVVSRFDLKLEPGLTIEFWAKGRTSLEHWQAVAVGISRAQFDEYKGIEGQPFMLVRIYIAPATEAEIVGYWLGQEKWEESFTPLNDSWHHYQIEIGEDGVVYFYRDGKLKFSPRQRIDFDVYREHPLVIEGRSEATDMLVDNLRVYNKLAPKPSEPLVSMAPSFVAGHILDSELGAVTQISAGDLDGDGDLDLVAPSNNGLDSHILIFQNPGTLSDFPWTPQILGKSSAQLSHIAVADYDLDGDLDVVSGSALEEDFELIIWQNDGTPFDGIIWRANSVGKIERYVTALVAADMDQDGDMDLVFGGEGLEPVKLKLWENNGAPFSGLWPRHDLATTDDTIYDLKVADLDGDGDLDITTGGRRGEDYEIIAWENQGDPLNGPWEPTDVGLTQGDVGSIAVADVDDDGFLDLISGGGYRELHELFIWQNDGTPFDDLWSGQMLGPNPSSEMGLAALDYDQDGIVELVSGSQAVREGTELTIWERDENAFQAPWTAQGLGDPEDVVRWIEPVDLDGDGDLDLVTAGNQLIVVWENEFADP